MVNTSALQKNESAEEWYKLLCEKWDSANEGEFIKKEDATKTFSDYFMYLQRLKHDENNGCKKYEQAGINWCLNTLNELPTYSFPEREKGEWIKIQSGDKDFPESIVCSKCKNENSHLDFNEHGEPIGKVFVTSKFCPNCGADMRGKSIDPNDLTHMFDGVTEWPKDAFKGWTTEELLEQIRGRKEGKVNERTN